MGFMSGEDVQRLPEGLRRGHQQGARARAGRLPLRVRRRDRSHDLAAHQAITSRVTASRCAARSITRAGAKSIYFRDPNGLQLEVCHLLAAVRRRRRDPARPLPPRRARKTHARRTPRRRSESRASPRTRRNRPRRACSSACARSSRSSPSAPRDAEHAAQARRRRDRGAEGDRRLPQLRAEALRRLRDRPRAVRRHRRRGERGVRVDRLDHDLLHGAQLAARDFRAGAPGGDLLAPAVRARARQREPEGRQRDTEGRRLRAHGSLAVRHGHRARRLGAALGPDRDRARGARRACSWCRPTRSRCTTRGTSTAWRRPAAATSSRARSTCRSATSRSRPLDGAARPRATTTCARIPVPADALADRGDPVGGRGAARGRAVPAAAAPSACRSARARRRASAGPRRCGWPTRSPTRARPRRCCAPSRATSPRTPAAGRSSRRMDQIQLRLTIAHVVRDCRSVVRDVMEGSGASVHYLDHELQRISRDVQMMSAHTVFDLDLVGRAVRARAARSRRTAFIGRRSHPCPASDRSRATRSTRTARSSTS